MEHQGDEDAAPSAASSETLYVRFRAWLRREWVAALCISLLASAVYAGMAAGAQRLMPDDEHYEEEIVFASQAGVSWDVYSADLDGANEVPVAVSPQREHSPSISPSGSELAYVITDDGAGTSVLHVGDPLGAATTGIAAPPSASDYAPSWSSTEGLLAFTRSVGEGTEIHTLDVRSGFTQQITTDGGAYAAWNPAAPEIAYEARASTDSRDIKVVNIDSGAVRTLTTDSADDIDAAWTPDGNRLVFSSNRGGDNYDLYIMDVASGDVQRLTNDPEDETDAAVSPDGKMIAYTYGRSAADQDVRIMTVSGTRQKDIVAGPSNEANPTWSPDGSRVFFEKVPLGDSNIVRMEPGSEEAATLAGSASGEYYPSWSPDGKRVAFSSSTMGSYDIWTADSKGGDLQRITTGPEDEFFPRWSPDGDAIVFTRGREPDVDLFVVSADQPQEPTRLTRGGGSEPDWHPDGSSILFISRRDGESKLYTVDLLQGRESLLLAVGTQVSWPRWSPDGRRILFTTQAEESSDIAVLDVETQKVTALLKSTEFNDYSGAWSPDGRRVAWVSDRNGDPQVYVADMDDPDGTTEQLLSDGSRQSDPAWGQRARGPSS